MDHASFTCTPESKLPRFRQLYSPMTVSRIYRPWHYVINELHRSSTDFTHTFTIYDLEDKFLFECSIDFVLRVEVNKLPPLSKVRVKQ